MIRGGSRLYVDYREKCLEELLEDVCANSTYIQLPIGDYMVVDGNKATLVERKTAADFLSSIRSNRLWDQLLRMMKTDRVLGYEVKRRMLLIHGNFEPYFDRVALGNQRGREIRWSQLVGAFFEILFVYNTPIISVESDTAFTAFMRILVKRESEGKNDKLPGARWYRKPVKADLPVKDRKKYVLSALPYIGDCLAENLLEHFHTISNVASAQATELEKVPKIGRKRAELIYDMFH